MVCGAEVVSTVDWFGKYVVTFLLRFKMSISTSCSIRVMFQTRRRFSVKYSARVQIYRRCNSLYRSAVKHISLTVSGRTRSSYFYDTFAVVINLGSHRRLATLQMRFCASTNCPLTLLPREDSEIFRNCCALKLPVYYLGGIYWSRHLKVQFSYRGTRLLG